jgi:alginate O-acetyltransferase complex protein AlgJ
MRDFTTYRLRYTKILAICILISLLYMASQIFIGGTASFDSNLLGRNWLIEGYTRLRLRIGDRVFAQGVVGKDGWLEYMGNLNSFQNVPTMPPNGNDFIQNELSILYDQLRQRNIMLVVVIAPDKSTIYPDKLPSEIQKISSQSELDKLVNLIKQKGPPVLVDLRPALENGRKTRPVYYNTDTHWNAYGALIAYREIMKKVSQGYPELVPEKISSFKITKGQSGVHDIATLIGATNLVEPFDNINFAAAGLSWVTYNNDYPLPIRIATSSQDKLPKLLMYTDSFGTILDPLLAPHFSQSTFIQYHSSYQDTDTFKQIEVTKPDVVIIEFVERFQSVIYGFLSNYGLETKK